MKANNRPRRLTSRLKASWGACNLMGKRVNFSARSVITLRPQHLRRRAGRPHPHRHDRDLPETVSDHNIERLREAAHNGLSNYAGRVVGRH
jgi:DNA-directed RNA polymerase beta' subunit